MAKEILFNTDATDKIKFGITQLAQVVKSTMGPNGKNVVISDGNRIHITKDGVTAALNVNLKDPIANSVAQLVKQVANKTVLETGDGTTTATVLTESLYLSARAFLDTETEEKTNVSEFFAGMNTAIKDVVEQLKVSAKTVTSVETLRDIATISANGDQEIGEWISQAFSEVGFNGLVVAKPSESNESEFEIVKGISFDSGYVSPYFADETGEINYEKPLIFLFDDRIKDIREVMPILEYSSAERNPNKTPIPIVIIATGFDPSLFQTLIKSKQAGLIKPVLIKAPGSAETQPAFFGDLAISTGATLVSARNGNSLGDLKTGELISQYVGSCERIIVTANNTQVLEGAGSEDAIAEYVAQLQKACESNALSESNKLILKERISRLDKGLAIIHVGGESKVEANEKFERVDDAIGATKAAIAEGYIGGGGQSLLRIRDILINKLQDAPSTFSDSWLNGYTATLVAIQAPFFTICGNSDLDPKMVWADIKKRQSIDLGFGYNFKDDTFGNLIEMGIVDPVKVTRRALQNAASVAMLLLNSNTLMVEVAEQSSPNFNMKF